MSFLEIIEDSISTEFDNDESLWTDYWTLVDELHLVVNFFVLIHMNSNLPQDCQIEVPENMKEGLAQIATKHGIEDWHKSYFNIFLHLHHFVPPNLTTIQKQAYALNGANLTGLLNEFEAILAIQIAQDFGAVPQDQFISLYDMPVLGTA